MTEGLPKPVLDAIEKSGARKEVLAAAEATAKGPRTDENVQKLEKPVNEYLDVIANSGPEGATRVAGIKKNLQSIRKEGGNYAGIDKNSAQISSGSGQQEGDQITAYGLRDYLLGSTLDNAGIWLGQKKSEVGGYTLRRASL